MHFEILLPALFSDMPEIALQEMKQVLKHWLLERHFHLALAWILRKHIQVALPKYLANPMVERQTC